MVKKLKIKAIYNDFVEKVSLTEEQIKILNMLINNDSITKISMEIGVSTRTINYEIRKLKDLYDNYMKIEVSKLIVLIS